MRGGDKGTHGWISVQSVVSSYISRLVSAPSLASYHLWYRHFSVATLGYTCYTLTKLNEEVGSLCFVHLMPVLLAEVCVEVFKVAEG